MKAAGVYTGKAENVQLVQIFLIWKIFFSLLALHVSAKTLVFCTLISSSIALYQRTSSSDEMFIGRIVHRIKRNVSDREFPLDNFSL